MNVNNFHIAYFTFFAKFQVRDLSKIYDIIYLSCFLKSNREEVKYYINKHNNQFRILYDIGSKRSYILYINRNVD